MTKKKHVEGEQKPAAASLQALRVWLDANGLRRVALAAPLGANQMQLSRVLAGSGYLTATQRRAIEKFTKGAITVAMLEGKVAAPSKVEATRRAPVRVPAEFASPPRSPTEDVGAAGSAPRAQTPEDADRIVDSLAAKAMPAAFKVIIEQMVKGKSESERRRCAEILIEHLRGKAKQYEKREQLIQPVSDEALLRRLSEIEANLTGRELDSHGNLIQPPAEAKEQA